MSTFRFDLLSFWIGFLAATILWGIFSFLRPRFPVIRKRISKSLADMRARNLAGIEATTRQEVLKRAQRMHLTGDMFALDEILIEPRLIVPPTYLEKAIYHEYETLVDQTIPYTPDWPELAASYAVSTMSLAEAMEKGVNIALIGQPGTGKTVALAHFASEIARKSPAAGIFAGYTPCVIHILDLNLSNFENQDPADILIKAITTQFSLLIQPQIPRFLRRKLNENALVVLIDGVDELSPVNVDKSSKYIAALLEKYPLLRMVAACSSSYLDGITKAGLYPLALRSWNRDDRHLFIQKWGHLWENYISPEIRKQSDIQEIPSFFTNNWLESEQLVCSPFEWTIKTWLTYSGELNGYNGTSWLDAFIHRFIPVSVTRNAFEQLALRICLEGNPTLSFSACDKYISSLSLGTSPSTPTGVSDIGENSPEPPANKTKSKDRKLSRGNQVLEDLLQQGLLREHPGEEITFLHPIITGYLASFAIQEDPPDELLSNMKWPYALLCLNFLSSQTQSAFWIDRLVNSDQSPLLLNILHVGRWIKDAPVNAAWRSNYMRKLISLIQRESIPLSLRARLVSVCIIANDPAVSLLLKQLILSKSFVVRRLAALAYGALFSIKTFDELLELMIDPVPEVRNAACLALAAIRNPSASEALLDILIRGDESLQQAVAESLAYQGEEGHNILRDAITSQDLLVRRAAVLGLGRIRESWAKELLEKIAIEDGQWVVRNAAVQALDLMQKANPLTLEPLEPATQASWLIEFAGKQGVGLRPDQPAVEMLLGALKSGTPEEKIQALRYLRLYSEEGIIGAIYQIAYLEQGIIAEAGLYSVWFAAISGAKLPPLAQYGVG